MNEQKPKKGDKRWDAVGRITCMAYADGYLMVRRPGAPPFIMGLARWLTLQTLGEATYARIMRERGAKT